MTTLPAAFSNLKPEEVIPDPNLEQPSNLDTYLQEKIRGSLCPFTFHADKVEILIKRAYRMGLEDAEAILMNHSTIMNIKVLSKIEELMATVK